MEPESTVVDEGGSAGGMVKSILGRVNIGGDQSAAVYASDVCQFRGI